MQNAYHFVTRWKVQSRLDEVYELLGNATDLPRWWPSVYLQVKQTHLGNEQGLGGQVELFTKGWLPYTLRWGFVVTQVRPDGFSLRAHGDFVGEGHWRFVQEGEWLSITYDWRIEAQKPLLKYLSFLLKPLFAANHHWAMRMGERSLRLELARRQGQPVPPPPGPTFAALLPSKPRSTA